MKTHFLKVLLVAILGLLAQFNSYGSTTVEAKQSSFSSPAAAASFDTTGDLSREANSSTVVSQILAKKGMETVGARSFGCSSGCSVGCSTGCSVGCSVGCSTGCSFGCRR